MELIEGSKLVDEHPGCVKRVFTFRDRMLIFQALNAATAQGADAKTLGRLVKLQETLDQEGVDDYFAVMDLEIAKRTQAWAAALERHITTQAPDPGPRPKLTAEEQLGKDATYWIKAKLDEHIASVLKDAKFAGANAKHVGALLEKYGIKVDD